MNPDSFTRLPRRFAVGMHALGDTELRVLIWILCQRDAGQAVELDRPRMRQEIGRSDDRIGVALRSLADAGKVAFVIGKALGHGRGRQRGTATITDDNLTYRGRAGAESNEVRSRGDAESKPLRDRAGVGVGDRAGAGTDRDRDIIQDNGISFPLRGGGEWRLPTELLDALTRTYPELDVAAQIARAQLWCQTNEAKRKTARGMPAMLNRWMSNQRPAAQESSEIDWNSAVRDLVKGTH